MDKYLTTTVDKLKNFHYASFTLILGNETCDLDSTVCTLAYGSFLFWQYNNIKLKKVMVKQAKSKKGSELNFGKMDNSVLSDAIFIPVLNVDREDYELKTEVEYCLRENGITPDKLVFRNDYDFVYLVKKYKSNVILLDHHVLAKNDKFLAPFVTEIIDHRPVDQANWEYDEETKSVIETVGSCCTLITHRIKSLATLVAKEVDFFKADMVATDLLHCGIILDTVNFSTSINKGTPKDLETVEFLESLLKFEDPLEFRKQRLNALVQARKDVSRLCAAKLLRKDVKVVGDIVVPSFPILVEEYLRKPEALEAVCDVLCARECRAAALLGMRLGERDQLQRDVAVYADERPQRAAQLAKYLQEWKDPPLQLIPFEPLDKPLPKNCIFFKQMNLSVSRKQYIPAIEKFIECDKRAPYVPAAVLQSEVFEELKRPI